LVRTQRNRLEVELTSTLWRTNSIVFLCARPSGGWPLGEGWLSIVHWHP